MLLNSVFAVFFVFFLFFTTVLVSFSSMSFQSSCETAIFSINYLKTWGGRNTANDCKQAILSFQYDLEN